MDNAAENIHRALEILFYKYYNVDLQDNPLDIPSSEELLEMRTDERAVLESIYDTSFQVKDNNVWSVKLNMDYITKLYSKAETKSKDKENINYNNKYNNYKTTKKPVCKLFLNGPCRFGNKCKFLHELPKTNEVELVEDNTEKITYELEIRFNDETVYPYQVPIIFFKTEGITDKVPEVIFFKITARLVDEAKTLAQDGIPAVYSLVELLNNEEDIVNFLKFDTRTFPDPSDTLFPQLIGEDLVKKPLPTHYKKGEIKDNRANVNMKNIIRENEEIAKRFNEKTGNSRYSKMMAHRRNLPAWKKRKEILQTMEKSQVKLHFQLKT